jgi:hypothetical protein
MKNPPEAWIAGGGGFPSREVPSAKGEMKRHSVVDLTASAGREAAWAMPIDGISSLLPPQLLSRGVINQLTSP